MKAEEAVARAIREKAEANADEEYLEGFDPTIWYQLSEAAIEVYKAHLRSQGVEKIARAICEADNYPPDEPQDAMLLAQAALDAMLGEEQGAVVQEKDSKWMDKYD